MMISTVRAALVALAVFTLITGVLYPLSVTGVANVVWPRQARGSLIEADGRTIGSSLIGQSFSLPRYLWSRPSATAPHPWNAAASAGSNLGPSNPALTTLVDERVAAIRAADSATSENAGAPVPIDLVTSSGSGLDPHISPASAKRQAARVASVRGVPEERVIAIIEAHTERRTLGLLGEPRVNVLETNLALDRELR